MKLATDLARRVDASAAAEVTAQAARRAIAMLDLTSLGDADTAADVDALCQRAITPVGPVAAVCVWPRFVVQAKQALAGTPVRIATVVNFPGGDDSAKKVAADVAAARADGADEVDIVFPYRAFIDGERARPTAVVAAARKSVGAAGVLKVILESGAFSSADLLAWACRDALHAGADFLKTSTGKIPQGASPDAAAILLDAVHGSGKRVGVKISGGVRDAAAAMRYLWLADDMWGSEEVTAKRFRFGASGLLDRLLENLG